MSMVSDIKDLKSDVDKIRAMFRNLNGDALRENIAELVNASDLDDDIKKYFKKKDSDGLKDENIMYYILEGIAETLKVDL